MEYDAIVVHFGELWLKGANRGSFVKLLLDNMALALRGYEFERIANEHDRFVVYLNARSDVGAMLVSLSRLPGASWCAPALVTNPDPSAAVRRSSEFTALFKGPVRIEANRAYKQHSFDSNDIVKAFITADAAGTLGYGIDKAAKHRLYVNVTKSKAFLYMEKFRGVGGLPVGSSGRAVILLSGGIDSPVASFYAMKRGLYPIYLHFHAFADNTQASGSKIRNLCDVLLPYSGTATVYYVPVTQFQAMALKAGPRYELVLFKRFMYKVAEAVAKIEGAASIVTGESIGQVASQTVENITASQKGIKLPILRPLSGFDKEEIVDKAKQLGTYALSIQTYRDVCSMKARNPSTRASIAVIDKLYLSCGMSRVVLPTVRKSLREELALKVPSGNQ